jgi:hypothetical protein
MHDDDITDADAKRVLAEYKNRTRSKAPATGYLKNLEGVILSRGTPGEEYHIDELALFCIKAKYSPGSVGPATSYMVDVSKTLERTRKGYYRIVVPQRRRA